MYTTARAKLPLKLMGGDAPGEREIAEEQQNIAEMMAAESGDAGAAAAPTANPRGGSGARAPIVATDGRGGARGGAGGGPVTDPKLDPKVRARVARARSIRMYVSDGSFDTSPIVAATAAPEPAEMWFAQMQLWAQSDIVDAIAAFNNDAVANVTDTDPYVEHSPVKRLERVKVWGYMAKNFIPFPPVGDANEMRLSFTGKVSDEQFDVVRVTVTVIIDQREVLRFMDRLMRQNFYNCVHMEYGVVDRTTAEIDGYAYGTAPVVRLTLDLEAYYARKAYQELMPPDVQTLLGVTPQG
ncbi:MAG: hypothetical protein JNG88_18040 [Phycisphaerales bacterium]|nr:hypothetical protein [Phycisphaerales bacterium]